MTPEEKYEKSKDFKEYIDKFCASNQCTKEDAFKHWIILNQVMHIYKGDE